MMKSELLDLLRNDQNFIELSNDYNKNFFFEREFTFRLDNDNVIAEICSIKDYSNNDYRTVIYVNGEMVVRGIANGNPMEVMKLINDVLACFITYIE